MNLQTSTLDANDIAFIREAAHGLEHPGRIADLLNTVGRPTDAILKRLPGWMTRRIELAIQRALMNSMEWAVRTLDSAVTVQESDASALSKIVVNTRGPMHVAAASILGGISGAFGIVALPIELPVTTLVILRSIASIARDRGADLDDPATRLECVSVLGLGGPVVGDEVMESSYLTSRVGLALLIRDASGFIAGRTAIDVTEAMTRGVAPEMFRLISAIANRFGYAAMDLAYAQVLPIAGAVGGAALNGYFASYFNRMARYHFGLRRLERIYGEAAVQNAYRDELRRVVN